MAEGHLSLVNDLTSSARLLSLEKSSPAQQGMLTGDKEALLSCYGLECAVCAQLILIFLTLLGVKIFFLFDCLEKKNPPVFFPVSETVHIKVFIIPFSFCVKLMFKLERKWEAWQFR